MTSPKLVFYLTCLFLCKMAQMSTLNSSLRQESVFISASVGQNITLQCFFDSNLVARYYWYKQTLGQKPKRISSYYVYEKKGIFYDEYKNNPRFSLDTQSGQNHLIITNLSFSDSATYYCASSFSVSFEFGEGATVNVKDSGSNVSALVHQSDSKTIQPGGSVTLNCTVQTGTCDGEHSVYWFKDSEEAHPGIIYTHGDRNKQCVKKSNTQTQSCVYNLPMKNLNVSHAGTYYCAVASCGHILFGNGTKLHVVQNKDAVYFLSGALTFTTILNIVLMFSLCSTGTRNSCRHTESEAAISSTTNAEGSQDGDNLHYSALTVKRTSRSSQHRGDTEVECVYSRIKK